MNTQDPLMPKNDNEKTSHIPKSNKHDDCTPETCTMDPCPMKGKSDDNQPTKCPTCGKSNNP